MTRRPSHLLLDAYTAGQLVAQLINRELEARDVSPRFYALISALGRAGPLTPTELALEMGYAPATLYDYVQQLIEDGHVRRNPNPADRRSYLISLTAEGERLWRRGHPAVRATEHGIEAQLERPLEEIVEAVVELKRATQAALAAAETATPARAPRVRTS